MLYSVIALPMICSLRPWEGREWLGVEEKGMGGKGKGLTVSQVLIPRS